MRSTVNLLVPPYQGILHPLIFFVFEKLQDCFIEILKNELSVFYTPFLAGG
jgi:hypothetical protein